MNQVGIIHRINGPVIELTEIKNLSMMELVYVGHNKLVGEVIKLIGSKAVVQIYEDPTSLKPDEPVFGSGTPLSVTLAPGIIGTIYDGIQRPLKTIQELSGYFIERGINVSSVDEEKKWDFKPILKSGDIVTGGMIIGEIPETVLIMHKVLIPPDVTGKITFIVPEGTYTVNEKIAEIENETTGKKHSITIKQKWPVRKARPYKERLSFKDPLITGLRVIDSMFPLPKGGTVMIPGGFGTGKTMTQHSIAKWCDADVIIFVGCGERGNEITDVLKEFPELIDPRSNKPLMERTIIIANTSNMPVAAREASIYTGITLAEYYRDMGYNVALMADSTSRWAEALRELSGRMEEMPAEEGFPAYLPTRLAEFYERAGRVTTLSDNTSSISIIGAVSPPGGDFSEPVTQHTKRFVRAFWALDKQLANARHYPAISWLESYSEYIEEISEWWNSTIDPNWSELRHRLLKLLQEESKLQQVAKLVGADVLPDKQRLILEIAEIIKNTFLQQNSFDKIDMFSTAVKQFRMLKAILLFYDHSLDFINHGGTILNLRKKTIFKDLAKMKYEIANDEIKKFDIIEENINSQLKTKM